ncbi:hypothetical protein AL755_03875 (plasmid) [Arthrobacter sp. ERGS1:01]|nr:hypothetical protein AL755_03875 [Arthrobacter sp. ERGS1:01]
MFMAAASVSYRRQHQLEDPAIKPGKNLAQVHADLNGSNGGNKSQEPTFTPGKYINVLRDLSEADPVFS